MSLVSICVFAAVLIWYRFAGTAKVPAVSDGGSGANEMLGLLRRIENPQRLPEFHFVDSSGIKRTLADFSGKTVLINLWATWCPPCRQEMPSLDRLHARLGGDDFQVLAISTDLNGISVVQEFYRTAGIVSLEAYMDQDGETENTLKVPGLPTTLLVDKKGNAIAVRVGPAEWDSEEMERVIAAMRKQQSGAEKQ